MGGYGWLGSRVVRLACWTQAQKGPGSNRSRDAVKYSNGSLCDRMSVRPFVCPSVGQSAATCSWFAAERPAGRR